jgi:hypothetical protein
VVGHAAARDRLRAYALMEDIQGHAHVDAARQLAVLEAEALRSGRVEAALLAAVGGAMYGLLRSGDRAEAAAAVESLVVRAEAAAAPSLLAMALALRALAATERHDSAAVLSDAGRAVALVDDELQPAVERCTALVVCAAAYNTLSLWELADELYDRAAELEPACEQPVQAPAVAVNRLVIRLEWAAALLEADADADALEQLRRAADAARQAGTRVDLQPLWALEVGAAADVLTLAFRALELPGPDVEAAVRRAADRRRALAAAGSVELLPLLAGLEALSLHRLGRDEEARTAARALPAASLSSGALSFPAWVQAQVLGGAEETEAREAHRRYGLLVT